jgi:pimeloyl-ACP methyl ester carboxylesterase
VTIDGLQIAYQQAGSDPPLLLLHGGPIDSRSWRPQIEAFSGQYTVVAWDAPGCGQSSDPPGDWRMEEYADCLAEFIEALQLERPHVLGLSWGGGLALQLYARYPHLPRSLILASAYAGWAGSLPPEEVERRLQKAIHDADLPPEQFVPGFVSTLFTKSAPQDVIDEVSAIISDAYHPSGMKTMLRAFAACDLRETLPTIAVPTLLLYGELDVRSPLHVAEEMHRQIPESQLVVMPGVGHLANVEAPDQFNAEVHTFLSTVP